MSKRQVIEHLHTSRQQIPSEESFHRTGALPELASFYSEAPRPPNPQQVALQTYDLTHDQRQEGGEVGEEEREQEREHREEEQEGGVGQSDNNI